MSVHISDKQNNGLYVDVYRLIHQFLDFKDKIESRKVCKMFSEFQITDLYNIEYKYTDRLANAIIYHHTNPLEQPIYRYLTQLRLRFIESDKRFSLNFLTKLTKLD